MDEHLTGYIVGIKNRAIYINDFVRYSVVMDKGIPLPTMASVYRRSADTVRV